MVSTIVVNYNGKTWLEKFLDSAVKPSYPKNRLEVIVVDNGSNDGSVEYIKRTYKKNPAVKIIENVENVGYANAVNRGLAIAEGQIFFVVSNDVEIHPQCIKQIVEVLSDPSIGIVQPNIKSISDRKTLDSGLNYLDMFGFSYGYAPLTDQPKEITFAEGICWATRRDVIENIGYMEEYYFMEYDDQDLCWRALLAGYRNMFVPRAIVYHVRGGTQGKTFFDRTKNAQWYVTNHITTLIKNLELKNLLKAIPVVLTIEIGKATYLTIKGRWKLASNTLRGLFIVLRDIRLILKKRREVQTKIRKVSDHEIVKYFHPFNLRLLYSFISSQKAGKRFILKTKPPLNF